MMEFTTLEQLKTQLLTWFGKDAQMGPIFTSYSTPGGIDKQIEDIEGAVALIFYLEKLENGIRLNKIGYDKITQEICQAPSLHQEYGPDEDQE